MTSIIIYHNPKCSKSRKTLGYIKDKNNPNFLNVYIDYSIGAGGVTTALGIETMTGQIRRKSAAAAVDKLNNIASICEGDSLVLSSLDLENGKVRLFAVSDDFEGADVKYLSEIDINDPVVMCIWRNNDLNHSTNNRCCIPNL